MKNLFIKQKEDEGTYRIWTVRRIGVVVVTAALKIIRKFAQKYCTENDVLSLRKI